MARPGRTFRRGTTGFQLSGESFHLPAEEQFEAGKGQNQQEVKRMFVYP